MWDFLKTLAFGELLLLLLLVGGLGTLLVGVLVPISTPWFQLSALSSRWRWLLVLIGTGLMSPGVINAANQFDYDAKGRANGELCSSNPQCDSGRCTPGPHTDVRGSSLNYCIAADRFCALPKLDGAEQNAVVFMNGSRLVCDDPGPTNDDNRKAQFFRPL